MLYEIKALMFERSDARDGVDLEVAYELSQSRPEFRRILDHKAEDIKKAQIKRDIKRVIMEETVDTDGSVQPHYGYPIPLGGAKYLYKRWGDMTASDYHAWKGMQLKLQAGLTGVIQMTDARYDEVREIIEANPHLTIGEARRRKQMEQGREVYSHTFSWTS